ncbi:HEPN domain-containing protein [Oecophyllibacter saccharovorans]|uniref:HEPN domain-containing protein n=1 Tax=Oecophyllibacter saccharovorans TaxID=2558360 RepID=UPI0011443A89|nr:HEPN domain-containing protein [Oecophyllibacter saccharovorans]QDH15000.1 HEPN domain-containing protein [Oecophyllibacter saccharovorans]
MSKSKLPEYSGLLFSAESFLAAFLRIISTLPPSLNLRESESIDKSVFAAQYNLGHSIETFLKSFIIKNGGKLEKNHELKYLLEIAIDKGLFCNNKFDDSALLENFEYSLKKIVNGLNFNYGKESNYSLRYLRNGIGYNIMSAPMNHKDSSLAIANDTALIGDILTGLILKDKVDNYSIVQGEFHKLFEKLFQERIIIHKKYIRSPL